MAATQQTTNRPANGTGETNSQNRDELQKPMEDLVQYARDYAKEQPEMAAIWCLGIGFVLGWKLKPW